MIVSRSCGFLAFVSLCCCVAFPAAAEPVETQIPGVSAELVELRQNNGVLRLAVRLIKNADKDASPGSAIKLSDLVLVDAKSKKKHFPLRGADGNYIGGPASDWGDGVGGGSGSRHTARW
jgi:hypothetical protein